MRAGRRRPPFRDGMFELGQGEEVAQAIQNKVRHLLVDADVQERAAEQGLVELLVRHDPHGLGEAAARVDLDLVVGIDDARAEDDGGYVPLARRPQAHDDPHGPGGDVALVEVRHDRGIEEGRRFDGILRGQVGPDQHAAVARAVVGLAGDFQGHAVVLVEHGGDVAVAGAELQEHLVQQAVDLPVAEGLNAGHDAGDPRLSAGVEEAGDDAAKIAAEGDRQTPHAQRARPAFSVGCFHQYSLASWRTERSPTGQSSNKGKTRHVLPRSTAKLGIMPL